MSGQAKRGKMIMELKKGKQIATRLQTLLQEPEDDDGIGLGLAQQLALQILASFTDTLSEMGSYAADPAQISAVDCGASGGKSKKSPPPGVKERRGCYKRRKTSDSWATVSATKEDGCAWRKYGQKAIMSSTYPRCYFRCTHKYEGCKATKQVQRTLENPSMYQITYFNRHTCTEKLIRYDPHDLTADSDHVDPNLICFETNMIQSKQAAAAAADDQYSPNPMSSISQVKEEFKEEEDNNNDYGRDDRDLGSDEAKSTLHDPWQDIHTGSGLDSLEYKPEWAPIISSDYQDEVASGFGTHSSYEGTNLYGLDEEVNQLGDVDYSFYF